MSKRIEIASKLRNCHERHYNCAQSVLMAFCDDTAVDAETAAALAAHFGGGMRVGSVCGAISGALMALGLLNADKEKAMQFIADFEMTNGNLNCAALLEKVSDDLPQKKLCDRLIIYSVNCVENLTQLN